MDLIYLSFISILLGTLYSHSNAENLTYQIPLQILYDQVNQGQFPGAAASSHHLDQPVATATCLQAVRHSQLEFPSTRIHC